MLPLYGSLTQNVLAMFWKSFHNIKRQGEPWNENIDLKCVKQKKKTGCKIAKG